jgi:hypothetical protein
MFVLTNPEASKTENHGVFSASLNLDVPDKASKTENHGTCHY